MNHIDRRMSISNSTSIIASLSLCLLCCGVGLADFMADLAKPHEGRSMRATSTHKIGPDGKATATFQGHTITLSDLQPYPVSTTKIDPKDYEATVTVG